MRFSALLRLVQIISVGCALSGSVQAAAAEQPWQPPGTVEITESVVAYIRGGAGLDKDRTTYLEAILGSFTALEKAENAATARVEALGGVLKRAMAESNQLSLAQMAELQEACAQVAVAQEEAARAYERFPLDAAAALDAAAFNDRAKAKAALTALLAQCRLAFAAAWHRTDAAMHQRMASMLAEARKAVAPDLVIAELGRPRSEANDRKKRIEAAFKAGALAAP